MIIEPDHYAVLELKPGSPMEEVKSQYRQLAKRCHPDLHGNDAKCQEQFRRVNAAYTFLSDAPRKAAYDACLQAPRKMAVPSAPAPKPPLPAASRASTTAAGYHVPLPTDARMTRPVWLGATAGIFLVLLVIGLSLDGSGTDRPLKVEAASPAAPKSASGSALGDGLEPGAGPPADPLSADSLSAPLAVPAGAFPSPTRHAAPNFSYPFRPGHAGMMGRTGGVSPFRVGSAWTPARAEESSPADALKQRLLARYQAVLPRADRLIKRGYAVRAASADTEDGSRRILRDQLAADLADLSAARARVRPGLARLSRQDTPEELRQETGPVLADMRRLEDARQPVRDDIKALAAVPGAFRFGRPAPARSASVVSSPAVPADPAPTVAPALPEAPKAPDKRAVDPAVKPKAPASSGQQFITWGE